jgi:hypothetical protein
MDWTKFRQDNGTDRWKDGCYKQSIKYKTVYASPLWDISHCYLVAIVNKPMYIYMRRKSVGERFVAPILPERKHNPNGFISYEIKRWKTGVQPMH